MSNKSEATWHPNNGPVAPHETVYYRYEQRQLAEARAERDALAHVREQVRGDMHLTQMTADPNDPGAYVLGAAAERAIFDSDPAVSLALHDAEAKAQALDEAAEAFAAGGWSDAFLTGDVQDDVSAVQATDAWFKARAAAIREEAK